MRLPCSYQSYIGGWHLLAERQDSPALVQERSQCCSINNVINSWPKVRLNQTQIETVCVIETDLPLLPDDAAYDHEAFNGFVEAIRSYLAEHPSFDRAELVPVREEGEREHYP
jgi:hypothetical protein